MASTHSVEKHLSSSSPGLELHAVEPVAVHVRRLTVSVEGAKPARDRFFGRRRKRGKNEGEKDGDEEAPLPARVKLLDDVSANMPSGSLTAIVGASGSGKTTL
jgi:ABC-type multidrug transport system ATPase subunit